MKSSLRVKKYLQLINLASWAITSFASCSNGRRMFNPKLAARPAPSWPAFMMPLAAPVMTSHPARAIRRPNAWAAGYAECWRGIRAEPNIATLRTARYGRNTLNAYRSSLRAAFSILRSPVEEPSAPSR